MKSYLSLEWNTLCQTSEISPLLCPLKLPGLGALGAKHHGMPRLSRESTSSQQEETSNSRWGGFVYTVTKQLLPHQQVALHRLPFSENRNENRKKPQLKQLREDLLWCVGDEVVPIVLWMQRLLARLRDSSYNRDGKRRCQLQNVV